MRLYTGTSCMVGAERELEPREIKMRGIVCADNVHLSQKCCREAEGETGQENEELSGSYSMSAYQLLRILVTYNTYECRRFSIMTILLPAFV